MSAETYDPGNKVTAATRAMGKRATENQKKRKSPAEEVPDQEEEEKKRTRGRPRLDTKDETAAEVSIPICYTSRVHSACIY